jgi:hypothetical protein
MSQEPTNSIALADIEAHLRRIDAQIAEHTRGFHNTVIYDIVAKGLLLLKANAAHNAQGTRTDRKKPRATVAQSPAAPGFDQWLEDHFPDTSRRSAYNYMNAARNAGLTSDHTLEDVDALRESLALHEKKPTDLYRLPDSLKPAPSLDDPAPPVNLAAQVQLELFSVLDQTITARESMDPATYEATWHRMQTTLEAFTGTRWTMQDAASATTDDSAQHGDTHIGKAPKPAKKPAKR